MSSDNTALQETHLLCAPRHTPTHTPPRNTLRAEASLIHKTHHLHYLHHHFMSLNLHLSYNHISPNHKIYYCSTPQHILIFSSLPPSLPSSFPPSPPPLPPRQVVTHGEPHELGGMVAGPLGVDDLGVQEGGQRRAVCKRAHVPELGSEEGNIATPGNGNLNSE